MSKTQTIKDAGWQLHPSTKTGHFFASNSALSACKREARMSAPVVDQPGIFPCTRCKKALDKGVS